MSRKYVPDKELGVDIQDAAGALLCAAGRCARCCAQETASAVQAGRRRARAAATGFAANACHVETRQSPSRHHYENYYTVREYNPRHVAGILRLSSSQLRDAALLRWYSMPRAARGAMRAAASCVIARQQKHMPSRYGADRCWRRGSIERAARQRCIAVRRVNK